MSISDGHIMRSWAPKSSNLEHDNSYVDLAVTVFRRRENFKDAHNYEHNILFYSV